MAYDGGEHPFNESSLLALPGGRIVAMVRTASGSKRIPHEEKYLFRTHSDDGGRTWSEIRNTGLWGYPPHLLLLSSGDVLCSYGYRRAPYGVRGLPVPRRLRNLGTRGRDRAARRRSHRRWEGGGEGNIR